MNVIHGDKKTLLLDAKIGDKILVYLITGKLDTLILSNVTRIGIEGFDVNFKNQPLTFYPFTSILKIRKHSPIE